MESIKVVFSSDMELCYDGINVKKYSAGEVYKPSHAHEKKMFEAFLADGRASYPSETKSIEQPKEKEVQSEKIVKPKQRKRKAK